MLLPTVVLYLIGTVLGVWSASLLWRVVHARLMRRWWRKGAMVKPPISTPRQVLGILLAIVCLPLGSMALAAGDRMQSWVAGTTIPLWYLGFGTANALLLVLATGAVLAGWWFDPARGRRRCPKCWYDMSGAPAARCPECGQEIRGDRDLARTRHSRGLVLIGLVLLAGTLVL